jgi:hypothetical protein
MENKMVRIGERVGAILGANYETGVVEFLGYGTYDGDFVPETAVGFMAEISREIGNPNPRITLDSGNVVWGCECWWGSEDKVRKTIEQAEKNKQIVITVDIDNIRARYKYASPAEGMAKP